MSSLTVPFRMGSGADPGRSGGPVAEHLPEVFLDRLPAGDGQQPPGDAEGHAESVQRGTQEQAQVQPIQQS